jgi:putative DNA primase/helicase
VSTPDVEEYRAEHAGEAETIGFSEDELALEFTRQHGDSLLYVHKWRRWHPWDGTRWREDETLRVFDIARRICRRTAEFAETEHARKTLRAAKTRAAVVSLAMDDRTHARVPEDFDRDPWLLNTPGGTVDLRSGELREHRRSDMITRCTTVTPGGKCELWLAALERWTAGDYDLKGFLQRLFGYALTGLTREEIFVFFYGTGGNGKSSALSLWTKILGDYAGVAPVEMLTATKYERHPADLASLRGARLAVAQETRAGREWDASQIKALTGGDPIPARFMRGDWFSYVPTFTLIVSGNNKPSLRAVDEAIRRRLLLVPFTVTITPEEREAIPDFKARLEAEAPGVLAWGIEGCLAWQRGGLQAPDSVRAATEEYFASQDTVSRWLEERCAVARNASATKRALYDSFLKWAEENHEFVLKKRELLERLRERLPELDETSSGKAHVEAFIGIGLLPEEDR